MVFPFRVLRNLAKYSVNTIIFTNHLNVSKTKTKNPPKALKMKAVNIKIEVKIREKNKRKMKSALRIVELHERAE